VLPQPYTGINPINMSKNMDEVVASVASMIVAGGDVSIKHTGGCHNCGRVKITNMGSYCRSCHEDTIDTHIIIVSTKRVFSM